MDNQDEQKLKRLMIEASQGNRESYKALLKGIEKFVRPFVRNVLTRAAQGGTGAEEDVVQEILLGVHTKRDTFDPTQAFLPWMYAIARYKAIDYLRFARVRGGTASFDDPDAHLPELASREENPSARMDLESVLEQLPHKQRDLVKLVKLDGLAVQEASLRTGFSPTDVRVSVHRGIHALKKLLGGEGK